MCSKPCQQFDLDWMQDMLYKCPNTVKQYWPKMLQLIAFARGRAADLQTKSRDELASLGVLVPDTYLAFLEQKSSEAESKGWCLAARLQINVINIICNKCKWQILHLLCIQMSPRWTVSLHKYLTALPKAF